MPSSRELDEQGWAAVQPFIASVEADPDRRRRFPIGDAYRMLLYDRPNIEARERDLPVAGTYRVLISLPTTEEEVVIRTSTGPIAAWRDRAREEVIGQTFMIWYAAGVDGIGSAEWPERSLMSIAMDSVAIDGGWMWRGNVWLGSVRGWGSPELASLIERWEEANPLSSLTFVRSRSGEVTFSGSWEIDGGYELKIRGVRVSEEARPRRY